MAVLDSNLAQAWTPEAYGALVDTVLAAKSVAFQAGTVVQIANETVRFPKWTADPATGWYAENAPISLTDPTGDELVVTPKKVAGLTLVSNEAASDTTPAVADQIGNGLARSISRKVDSAFFGNTIANGPSGLLSVSGVSVVDTGAVASITNLDSFHQAKANAVAAGANITTWLLSPDFALALSKAKQGTASNVGLLDTTGVGDGVSIAGVRALISPDIPAGNAWGIDASQVLVVQRLGTTIEKSSEFAFDQDATVVRGVARVAFGFANGPGIVRLYDAA